MAEVSDEVPEEQQPQEPERPAGPPRAPYSAIRKSFMKTWGYRDGYFDPEHMEILGPNGSGKTYAEATFLQDRVKLRNSRVVFIATKPLDATITKLGWPIVSDWKGVTKNRQVIFWPRTKLLGEQRNQYMAVKIMDLLGRLWNAHAKAIVVFDEVASSEGFSRELKAMIQMYWREARSVGMTILAMKQRPQGVSRDMHSEAAWIAAFKPKDEDDALRVAEVMGGKRQWMPILMGLNRDRHEFVLLHVVSGDAVITWIDTPLKPATPPRRGLYKGGT